MIHGTSVGIAQIGLYQTMRKEQANLLLASIATNVVAKKPTKYVDKT